MMPPLQTPLEWLYTAHVAASKTVTGFGSPEEAVMNRTCTSESGFFTSVPNCIRMPRMPTVMVARTGEPQGSPVLPRSSNPVSGYLPFGSGRVAVQPANGSITMAQLATIQFHDQTIVAIDSEGTHYAALRPIVENIGLDWAAQLQRIKRHPVMNTSVVVITTQMEGDDQNRNVVCLPVDMLNGWLFGVDVNRVRPELRERLMQYQRECFQVLNAHFNKREPLENLYRQNPGDKLNSHQQQQLRGLLDEFVKMLPKEKQGAFMMQGWSKLKSHFGVPYREIPAERFDEAVSLLTRHVVEHVSPRPIEAQPTAPSFMGKRWIMELDHTGREVARAMDWNDCILKYDDLPRLLAAPDNMVDGPLLADIATACLQRLARRNPPAAHLAA